MIIISLAGKKQPDNLYKGKIFMKKAFAVFLTAVMLFSMYSFTYEQQQPERVIILFDTYADSEIAAQFNGRINRMFSNFPALAITLPSYAKRLISMYPGIVSIEEDVQVHIESQTQDWGVTRIDGPAAWNSDYTGEGIKIAVVDTGIAPHEDLVVKGGVSYVVDVPSYTDDNGHGTHVAGIIGARNNSYGTVGIAPECDLYAVKVLDKDGSGYISDIAAGIDWAISNNMDIVNLSLGGSTSSSVLKSAVDSAYAGGILVVAAAGNSGNSYGIGNNVEYPARYDSVIAVAATNINNQRASFSSTGSTVEVAAPGVDIISTYLNNQYAAGSGTSMATPYTSGNLALIMQANPGLSAAEIRIKLRESVIDLGSAGKDTRFGYGLIQAPYRTDDVIPDPDPDPEPDPGPDPDPMPETKTAVSTDKSTYKAGEKVTVTTTVTNAQGGLIQGATIKITIKTPFGLNTVSTGTADVNGQYKTVYTTNRFFSIKGTYQVTAETSYSDHTPSTAGTSFTLK